MAYIALDRFRYTNRVINDLEKTLKKIRDSIPAKRDAALLRIRKRLKDISNNGLGKKIFFFEKSPRTFGAGNKSGWDMHAVCCSLILQFISIAICTLFSSITTPWIFYTIFTIAILGTLMPIKLILAGNNLIEFNNAYIKETLEDFEDVYKSSIKELQDKVTS